MDAHGGPEDQPRDGDGPEKFFQARLRRAGHFRIVLRPEVLDDHFLDMAIACVALPDRQQRLDALLARFSDPNKQARGKGHGGPPRRIEGGQAHRGILIRGAVVGHALFAKPEGGALEHHAHGGSHGL